MRTPLLHRETVVSDGLAAIVAGAPVVSLSFSSGGFFPPAWGWAAIAFALAAAAVLVYVDSVELGRLDVVMFLALCSFSAWILLSLLWTESRTHTRARAPAGADVRCRTRSAAARSEARVVSRSARGCPRRGEHRRVLRPGHAALPRRLRLRRGWSVPAPTPDRLLERARAARRDGCRARARVGGACASPGSARGRRGRASRARGHAVLHVQPRRLGRARGGVGRAVRSRSETGSGRGGAGGGLPVHGGRRGSGLAAGRSDEGECAARAGDA